MVSLKDIARRCGVSVATVSKALNDQNDISEATKKLVRETAAELGYFPNSSARALKTNRTPVLFVHGKEDRFVPVKDTMRNYEACVAEKDLLLVEGARHIQSYALGGDAYREKLRGFFRRNDQRSPAEAGSGRRSAQ